jgi:hypothetical protein
MDFAFLKMHFRNFANGFSIFRNAFAIYGNAFKFKKNAKSILEMNFCKIKNPFAKNAFPKSWNKNFKLCKRHMQ